MNAQGDPQVARSEINRSVRKSEWDRAHVLLLVGAFFTNMNTMGAISSFGIFQQHYTLERFAGYSTSTISWIGSVQSYLMFVLSVFSGPAFDAGYMKALTWTGSILNVSGLVITSFCAELWQCFLAQGLVVGTGFGCLYVSAPSLIGLHFEKHRALAMGLSSVGGGVGGIVFQVIFEQVEPRYGFGWATRILAFVTLATSIIPVCTVAYPRKNSSYNDSTAVNDRPSIGAAREKPPLTSWKDVARTIVDTSAFKEPSWLLGVTGLLFSITGLYTILNYINLFAVERQIVLSSPVWSMLLVINTASLFGRTVIVGLADYIGHTLFLTLTMLACATMIWCLFSLDTRTGSIVWSVCFGLASGAGHAVVGAVIVTLSTNQSRIGARQGMALGLVGHGLLVSSPIAGALLNSSPGWTGFLVWSACCMLLGALCAGAALWRHRKALTALTI